jgi:hypothetical protein
VQDSRFQFVGPPGFTTDEKSLCLKTFVVNAGFEVIGLATHKYHASLDFGFSDDNDTQIIPQTRNE